jgi:hypothetical protein
MRAVKIHVSESTAATMQACSSSMSLVFMCLSSCSTTLEIVEDAFCCFDASADGYLEKEEVQNALCNTNTPGRCANGIVVDAAAVVPHCVISTMRHCLSGSTCSVRHSSVTAGCTVLGALCNNSRVGSCTQLFGCGLCHCALQQRNSNYDMEKSLRCCWLQSHTGAVSTCFPIEVLLRIKCFVCCCPSHTRRTRR